MLRIGDDMDKTIVQLLEKICNVNAMLNTWLMWFERAFKGQLTYAPSVYQQRDAFSHIITIFSRGFNDKFLGDDYDNDLNKLFQTSHVKDQLEEVYGHLARAFFDCADIIYVELKEYCENDDDGGGYSFLGFCLNRYGIEVDELRNSKSATYFSSYDKMERWDKLLHIFSAAFELEDYYSSLREKHNKAMAVIARIEAEYSTDLLKTYTPDFFNKTIRLQKEGIEFFSEFNKLFERIDIPVSEVPSYPTKVTDEWVVKLKERIDEEERLIADFDYLYIALKPHRNIAHRKETKEVVSKMISQIVTPLTSLIAGGAYQVFSKASNTGTSPAVVSVNAIWIGLVIFVVGQVSALFIGRKSK